ncbi:B domain of TMEM189, localization domain containing protein [Trema orientale]|uniref:B domain of TMEM189, localization domain containing protein n=1 Tax=Trema orientale TaxID=63057 RepID=A0A2P5FRK6_TREOI|nr:B domain of TMEM189, localization domain containing protein [Trema orientale]
MKSIVGAANSHIWIGPTLTGSVEEFQGHHMWSWVITKRQFANNLHALGLAVTFAVLPIDLFCDNPIIHGFVSVCFGCILFSQQFHAWAHSTRSRLPAFVVALQDLGILLPRSQHADHHRPPYNNNYCIVSGIWNKFLDNQEVFKALEKLLFLKLGVRPRSWSDEPRSEWTHEESQTTSQLAPN